MHTIDDAKKDTLCMCAMCLYCWFQSSCITVQYFMNFWTQIYLFLNVMGTSIAFSHVQLSVQIRLVKMSDFLSWFYIHFQVLLQSHHIFMHVILLSACHSIFLNWNILLKTNTVTQISFLRAGKDHTCLRRHAFPIYTLILKVLRQTLVFSHPHIDIRFSAVTVGSRQKLIRPVL